MCSRRCLREVDTQVKPRKGRDDCSSHPQKTKLACVLPLPSSQGHFLPGVREGITKCA